MNARPDFRSFRRRALFAAIGFVVLGAVASGGWRLIEQDRALESERAREGLEAAASVVCAELDRAVGEWQEALRAVKTDKAAPTGATIVLFAASGTAWQAGARVPYLPSVQAPSPLPAALFEEAEAAEFRDHDNRKAERLYRAELQRGSAAARAEAWMRIARCMRRQQRTTGALEAYAELASFGAQPAGGSPAALTGRRERISIFAQLGDLQAARNEAELLRRELDEGRFPIDKATYDFFRACVSELVAAQPLEDSVDLADALAAASVRVRQASDDLRAWHLRVRGKDFVALARQAGAGTEVLVGPASTLAARVASRASAFRASVLVLDERGEAVFGRAPAGGLELTKTPAETRLPWSVRLGSADSVATQAAGATRRRQLLAALTLVLLILAGAGYATFRAVDREITVARLQSDFVAAVSHEFRTPLAAMSHLTESLEDGRVDEDRRPVYYRTLARENRRLTGMVENLLDFARMDAGCQVYRKDAVPLDEIVRDVVNSSLGHMPDGRSRIALDVPPEPVVVTGDGEALARAVRNLLNNAVKYSPADAPVRVAVSADRHAAAVSVQDSGPGIPRAEQRAIFNKFLRGSSARALNVKGTGIGLAMVRHIVDGHGGRVEVDSEPGRGSRFTIVLPLGPAGRAQETR